MMLIIFLLSMLWFKSKILKLLNDRNDNYWFCPDCAKPALNAIFMDKDIEEKWQ